jgi:multidrug efflux pump subunit AcrA (membrane-fusion protein)
VGLFVPVEIAGRVLPQATVIPRSALRQGDVVWVVEESSRLNFRKVKVATKQQEEVIVEEGLEDGEEVVISPLQVVTDGMAVSPVCETDWPKR